MNLGAGLMWSGEPELAVVVDASLAGAFDVEAGDDGHVELCLDIVVWYIRPGSETCCLSGVCLGPW